MTDVVDISDRYIPPVTKVNGSPADDFNFGFTCGKEAAKHDLTAEIEKLKAEIAARNFAFDSKCEEVTALKREIAQLRRPRMVPS